MALLTMKMQAKDGGIDLDGINCKACESDNITVRLEADHKGIVIHYVCNECGAKKRLTYKRDSQSGKTGPEVAGAERVSEDDNG